MKHEKLARWRLSIHLTKHPARRGASPVAKASQPQPTPIATCSRFSEAAPNLEPNLINHWSLLRPNSTAEPQCEDSEHAQID
jgi:hypothetical protein